MSGTVDITQNKQIQFAISAIVALGALTGIVLYFDRKKHMKLQGEIALLDKGIKELQLSKLKNGKT